MGGAVTVADVSLKIANASDVGSTSADWRTSDSDVASWFGPTHLDAYLRFKRVEAEKVAGLAHPELCARYAEVY